MNSSNIFLKIKKTTGKWMHQRILGKTAESNEANNNMAYDTTFFLNFAKSEEIQLGLEDAMV
jgi:hypothetical protein